MTSLIPQILKPCPFCDGEAEFATVLKNLYPFVVRCTGCGAQAGGSVFENNEYNARLWNQRSNQSGCSSQSVPSGLSAKVLELCSAVENDNDLTPIEYLLKCDRLISEVRDLTATPGNG